MKFGPVPLEEASGRLLAHNISDGEGRRVLRKGRTLDPEAIDILRELGHETVYVAELESGDVHEDEAATRIAAALTGPGVESARAHTGRVNVTALAPGVLRVDVHRLAALNGIPGVAVATLHHHAVVHPGDRVATVKIIPYGLARAAIERAEDSAEGSPAVSVDAIEPADVAVVLVGDRGAWDRLEDGMGAAIRGRVEALGCRVGPSESALLSEEAVAAALSGRATTGVRLIVVAGETAIMDQNDLIPRSLVRAGGRVEHLGLPMDPGQLLLLGYLGEIPVVGAPGCVRGRPPDGFDAVISRLLTGERLVRDDLQALGHGGLLSDPRTRA